MAASRTRAENLIIAMNTVFLKRSSACYPKTEIFMIALPSYYLAEKTKKSLDHKTMMRTVFSSALVCGTVFEGQADFRIGRIRAFADGGGLPHFAGCGASTVPRRSLFCFFELLPDGIEGWLFFPTLDKYHPSHPSLGDWTG